VLWSTPDEFWDRWLREKFKSTLGIAIIDTLQQLSPELNLGDLVLDIDPGPRQTGETADSEGLDEIWITETTLGGAGLIENFLVKFGEDPVRFFHLLESQLGPSDFELADEQLTLFIKWAVHDDAIRNLLDSLRKAETHQELSERFDKFLTQLNRRGLVVCHPVIAVINARILRPGSSHETDRMIEALITKWHSEEDRLGIELDPRVFAYVACHDDELVGSLERVFRPQSEDDLRKWRFGTTYSLLWPRGSVLRAKNLALFNPFHELPSPEPRLIIGSLPSQINLVDVRQDNWHEQVTDILVENGTVFLEGPFDQAEILKDAVIRLMADCIDAGFLFVYPCVSCVGLSRFAADRGLVHS
jgi:hypothetical protein